MWAAIIDGRCAYGAAVDRRRPRQLNLSMRRNTDARGLLAKVKQGLDDAHYWR
jgi:hypothetical protein